MGKIRIGVSGWSYDSWRGDYYPANLPRGEELAYVAGRLDTVEVNGTFYSLQRPEAFRGWYEQTPAGFSLAVKGSRYITHSKRLKDPRTPLANFFAQGVLALEEKLGPILWQLPDRFSFDPDRVGRFLDLLPQDSEAALELARRHDRRLSGRAWLEVRGKHRLRHVLEVRDDSFFVADLARLCRDSGTAIAFSHAGDWPYTEQITAGFAYLRLHGAPHTYASPYGDELGRWAERIERWHDGGEPEDAEHISDLAPPRRKQRDVYVYFDNDQRGHAPHEAERLAEFLR